MFLRGNLFSGCPVCYQDSAIEVGLEISACLEKYGTLFNFEHYQK